MNGEPKILVAAPTYSGKDYMFERWYENITHLTYKNYDHLIVDNSKGLSYLSKLRRRGAKKVIHVPRAENSRITIANSYETIRKYAIDKGYDYLMFIESDLLPPKDIIERLLAHNKDVCGACYEIGVGQNRRMCLYGFEQHEGRVHSMPRLMGIEEGYSFMNNGLKQVGAMGFGCTLIKRNIFTEYEFHYSDIYHQHSDTIFYTELMQDFVPVYADTDLLIYHENQNWLHVKDR